MTHPLNGSLFCVLSLSLLILLPLSLSPSPLSLSLSPSPLSLSPSLYTVYMYTLHCSLFRMCGHKLKCLLPCFKTKLFMSYIGSIQHDCVYTVFIYTCRVSWVRVPPEAAHFLRKSDCLGCTVLLCLAVCLTLIASFFLLSHLSLKHVTIKVIQCIYTYMCIACNDIGNTFLHLPPLPVCHRITWCGTRSHSDSLWISCLSPTPLAVETR